MSRLTNQIQVFRENIMVHDYDTATVVFKTLADEINATIERLPLKENKIACL